jgi:creatinine amidohydrolase
MNDHANVRAELLSPHKIESRLAANSVVYIPVGSLEYHQEHLPIGLDALTAHGVCIVTAVRHGGIVLPPLFYGTGGGHLDYPWTIMSEETSAIESLLNLTLDKLQALEVRKVVIFTGHFADEQLEMIEKIVSDFNGLSGSLKAFSGSVNMKLDGDFPPPDHAGVFETTLLANFWQDSIHLEELPDLENNPSDDIDGDPYGLHRHDVGHPLRGIFGPDPRGLDFTMKSVLLESLVAALAEITQ